MPMKRILIALMGIPVAALLAVAAFSDENHGPWSGPKLLFVVTPFIVIQFGLLTLPTTSKSHTRVDAALWLIGATIVTYLILQYNRELDSAVWHLVIIVGWLIAIPTALSTIAARLKGSPHRVSIPRQSVGIRAGLSAAFVGLVGIAVINAIERLRIPPSSFPGLRTGDANLIFALAPYALLSIGLVTTRSGRPHNALVAMALLMGFFNVFIAANCREGLRITPFTDLSSLIIGADIKVKPWTPLPLASAAPWLTMFPLFVLPLWFMLWGSDWISQLEHGEPEATVPGAGSTPPVNETPLPVTQTLGLS